MCDTLAIVRDDSILFGKNSDRDPNEAQILEWRPRKEYESDASVSCTYIEIPQVRETHALILSRPFWMWGAEMGLNDQGVVIGNEAVFTKQPLAKTGLLGMDLLRLALERAHDADSACATITSLIDRFGQGGGCGYEHRSFSYHNSFIIADAKKAIVLETAGKEWAVEDVKGARSISNCLTIPEFDAKHSDTIKTRVAAGRDRQCRTQALAKEVFGVAGVIQILRDHGDGHEHPHYSWVNGGMAAPCMHAGGMIAASQTTGSIVAELKPNGDHQFWATGTSAPCTSVFKPIAIDQPIDLGKPSATPEDSLWWRYERLHREVMKDPGKLRPLFIPERDVMEARWLESPPRSEEAFAVADECLERWTKAVVSAGTADTRPGYVRRYWSKRTPASFAIPTSV